MKYIHKTLIATASMLLIIGTLTGCQLIQQPSTEYAKVREVVQTKVKPNIEQFPKYIAMTYETPASEIKYTSDGANKKFKSSGLDGTPDLVLSLDNGVYSGLGEIGDDMYKKQFESMEEAVTSGLEPMVEAMDVENPGNDTKITEDDTMYYVKGYDNVTKQNVSFNVSKDGKSFEFITDKITISYAMQYAPEKVTA